MKVSDLKELGYKAETTKEMEDFELKAGYTGDLLSDVMANAPSDSILITIQAHKNTIAVATLAGIRVILICNNRAIPSDMIEAAEKENVAIYKTPRTQFEASAEVAARLGK
ncbi:MAG: iron-sulfur binding hydrogenase [Spirochaetia bacterium]|nr:iron-sulfur binding hydrogenase [Spirochaetia bacterium]